MKRWGLLAVLLALLVLSGCSGPEGGAAAQDQGVIPFGGAEPAEGGLADIQVDSQARPLSEEEIIAAYDRAEEAYGWFYLRTMPYGGEPRTLNGWTYYPVSEPGMENLSDLRAYLGGLFSQEMVEDLLASGGAHPLYQEAEGALYALPFSRERESKGDITVHAASVAEDAYSVEVTVELLEENGAGVAGVEYYAFPYELVEGQWVFTDFCLVY